MTLNKFDRTGLVWGYKSNQIDFCEIEFDKCVSSKLAVTRGP